VEGDRRVALPRGHARSLLGLLALHTGEVVSSDRLIDQLWGQAPPPTATKALHGLVSTLRKRLQPRDDGKTPPVLETRAPGYLLAIDRDQVDANRFRRLVAEAAKAPVATKAARLRDALGLWRGPALDEFAYEPFAQAAIAELEELRLAALEERVEADLALGRHAELVVQLEGLVAEHPLRERLRAQLMLALYRCGRQVDALELYRVTRELLVDGLGIEPGPALQRLERAILAQDPSLELPQPVDRTLTAEEVVQPSAGRWLAAGRRTVTVVFADLSGSAGAQPTVFADPEAVRPVVMQAYKAAVEVLGRHGATVEGFIGDVVVAVFGVPVAHEDDALRAVRAGLALREHLAAVNAAAERAHGVRLAARIGISTGEVVVGDPTSGGASTSGPPVALAARLQQAAGDGEVLLGEPTRRLVGDAAVLEPATPAVVDRLGGSGIAWRLMDVPQIRASAGADTPYVGRREELERLRGAFDRSVQEGRATLVTVIGEAGVGKSRLAREFATSVEPAARVVTGHCPPYGDGITFWPLREILRELTNGSRLEGLTELLTDDPDPSSTAEVAGAVGMVDQPGDPSALFGAVRRLFEAVARRKPLVIIVEDIHWAQPTLLDLLENLAASTHQPLVLLCLARPEFRERRTSWAQELDAAVTVPLAPLDPGDSERLLTSRRFGRALPPEAVTRVVETAQGNPLFLEQLLAALRDDLELRIPPTVQALLTARLDRLGPAEQDLLRCASVIGLDFSAEAVTALVAHQAIPFVDRHLEALEAKELVTPVRGPTPPSKAFRFRHVLIQLAAYGSLTHQDRSELHERFADWLERETGERVGELEELIGRHLEQAYMHRRDLGLADATGEALALRAGERLASAGLRAYGRFDVPAAENLLSRAKALLPAGHDQRPKVLRRLTEAYPIMGRPGEAEAAFAELLDEVGGDDRFTRGIRLEQTRFRLITGPDPISLEVIRQQTEAALEAFRDEGDQVRMSQAHYILSSVHLRAGRIRQLEETARRGLVHAHRSGDLRELLGAPWWIVFALLAGPTPVPACLQACEELVDAGGLEHIGVLAAMGHFKAMLGDFERARELVAHAQHVLRERLRLPRPRLFVGLRTAEVEVLAGNPEAAERALRPALDVALMVGDREQASLIAAELSLLLSRRGASDEAARAATLAADQAPAESVSAQALAGAARARVLLGSGDHRVAERFAREAIKPVPDDMLNLRASLLVGLAEILLAAGRHDEAQPVSAEAVQLYERKRNLVAAQSFR
jgi:DNA-binding SARP family transcriptional activator/tetratricopeptide (TPR) repeat protein